MKFIRILHTSLVKMVFIHIAIWFYFHSINNWLGESAVPSLSGYIEKHLIFFGFFSHKEKYIQLPLMYVPTFSLERNQRNRIANDCVKIWKTASNKIMTASNYFMKKKNQTEWSLFVSLFGWVLLERTHFVRTSLVESFGFVCMYWIYSICGAIFAATHWLLR